MEIEYKSNKLKKILSDPRLIKRYHSDIYITLINRLSELKSVNNLSLISILPPPRRHKLSGEYTNCWSIDVSKNQRLIIKPHDSQIGFNDTEINKIIILKIVDYH